MRWGQLYYSSQFFCVPGEGKLAFNCRDDDEDSPIHARLEQSALRHVWSAADLNSPWNLRPVLRAENRSEAFEEQDSCRDSNYYAFVAYSALVRESMFRKISL